MLRGILKEIIQVNKVIIQSGQPIFKHMSFSQTGEDCIISFIFDTFKIKCPTYIDIGAFDPYKISNTAKFYLNGSRGINIEPNPDQFAAFLKHRPKDINLNIGVSDKCGYLKYYVMDEPTLNTFSETDARENVAKWGRTIKREIDIRVETLESIIAEHANGRFPDFMNLDVEGIEMKIIECLISHNTRPKVICLETLKYTEAGIPAKKNDTVNLLCDNGYYLFADTLINSILVQKHLWDNR